MAHRNRVGGSGQFNTRGNWSTAGRAANSYPVAGDTATIAFGTIAAGQTPAFRDDLEDVLQIATLAHFAAGVIGFRSGNTIDLGNIVASTPSYSLFE